MFTIASRRLDLGDALPMWPRLVAVVVSLFVVRLLVLSLSDLSLHGDEAQYWIWAQEPALGYYSKPPLIAWAIGLSTALCGDAPACVRAPAALFQSGTALIVGGLAASLYGRETGFWSGIAWATLPAVSFSSLIMSTDALLLLFWAGALWAYRALLKDGGWRPAVLLALCLALGLNAKYAMAYFLLCIAVHLLIDASAWAALRRRAGLMAAALAAGLVGIAPNLLWNAGNGWATVGHTADNANWQGPVLHPEELLAFLGSQFGVFGPVFFAAFLLVLPRGRMALAELSQQARFLLAFSVPILAVVAVLALSSRANANWAAAAFPAATVLVVATLLDRRSRRVWLFGSIGLHAIAAAVLYVAVLMPDTTAKALGRDPFAALAGMEDAAGRLRAVRSESDADVILLDNRLLLSRTAYALWHSGIPIRAWNHDRKIDHHFEMAWRYDSAVDGDRVLLLTPHGDAPYREAFAQVKALPDLVITDRVGRERRYTLRVLEGPR